MNKKNFFQNLVFVGKLYFAFFKIFIILFPFTLELGKKFRASHMLSKLSITTLHLALMFFLVRINNTLCNISGHNFSDLLFHLVIC